MPRRTKALPHTLSYDGCAGMPNLGGVIKVIVATFSSKAVEAWPKGYFEKQVFDEKPGVG